MPTTLPTIYTHVAHAECLMCPRCRTPYTGSLDAYDLVRSTASDAAVLRCDACGRDFLLRASFDVVFYVAAN